MKRSGHLAVLSVLFLATGANAFLGDLFKGWGIGVGGSVGVGGTGVSSGIGIGAGGNGNVKDYSEGTGAGIGGTLSLGPFGSINLGFGLGNSGSKAKPNEVVPKAGIWSWLPKMGFSNTPEFKGIIESFLTRFPLFKQIENSDSPAAFVSIFNSLRNNPSLMKDILSYLNAQSADGQKAVLFILNQILSGVPDADVNINGLPGADDGAKYRYRLLIDSLAPQSKELVRVALSALTPPQQKNALDYLVNTYKDSIGQNGVKITVTPSTMQNVVKVASTTESVRDFGGINVGGGGGGGNSNMDITLNIQNMFINQPDMQSTLNVFWSRLTPESKVYIQNALMNLDMDGRRAVLNYLIQASSSLMAQPRTKIVFDNETVQQVVTLYKQNQLGSGNVNVKVVNI